MKKEDKFRNRWRITGTLTTESELHIGDGGSEQLGERLGLSKAADRDTDADYSTVARDHEGKAYLPASAIKGTLRAALGDRKDEEPWRDLFGSSQPEAPDAVGGRLELWDALHKNGSGTRGEQPTADSLETDADRNRPWWHHAHRTCVAVSVSLDRRTRTADENLLYHVEYVPVGETFEVEISGTNLEDDHVAEVLRLLERFNGAGGERVTLGARASSGWGRVRWSLAAVDCINSTGLKKWKKTPTAGLAGLLAYGVARKSEAVARAKQLPPVASLAKRLAIELDVLLDSPWLIRDPRQRGRSEAGARLVKQGRLAKEAAPMDASPVLDESGKPFIPSKSLRGALRARAEMILRTLDLPCADHPRELDPVSTKGRAPDDVLDDIGKKDLAARLFGLSGWRAPLRIPRMAVKGKVPGFHRQEFVAIDRFTGGAAEKLKFNAQLAGTCKPGNCTLTGTLEIDLERLERVDPPVAGGQGHASVGLLALVLRDLAEGDIPIGSGSAKGQGQCSATIRIDGSSDWRQHPVIRAGVAALRAQAKPTDLASSKAAPAGGAAQGGAT